MSASHRPARLDALGGPDPGRVEYWRRVAGHYDRKGRDDLNFLAASSEHLVHHHTGLFEPGTSFDAARLAAQGQDEILKEIGAAEQRLADLGLATLERHGARGPGLDCGCGRGGSALSFALRRDDLEIDGITVSETQLHFARSAARALALDARVAFAKVSVFDLPPALTDAYGFVYACESTEYMAPRERLFQTFERLLRPDGVTVVFAYMKVEGHPALDEHDFAIVNDHYVMRTGSVQEYLRASSAAGLGLADWIDLRHEILPYWTLRVWSRHRAGIEEPVLRCLRSDAVKYALLVLRKPGV